MRRLRVMGVVGIVALFSACNALLGNESDYELVGNAGDGGEAGSGGTAGRASGGRAGGAGSAGTGGGNPGRGGANASGDAGMATSGASGDSGAGDTAGASGEAGGPSCMSSGPENCFNRVDDDCNGDIDCEDEACNGPAECRPAPEGAELGYFAGPGDTCASGYGRLDLHQDLQASYECTGCACINPTSLLCDAGVYGHGQGPCPSTQYEGVLRNMYNDRCGPLPVDTNYYFFSVRGTAECTPSGTPTLEPTSWGASSIFCLLDSVGAGCSAGKACMPAETADLCVLSDDEAGCSADFAVDRGTWYQGVRDDRECTPCSCGLGTADCSGAYIAGYTDGGCSSAPTPLGNGAQGEACGLPTPLQTGRIIGTPTNGSCQANNFVSGEATAVGERKACCEL